MLRRGGDEWGCLHSNMPSFQWKSLQSTRLISLVVKRVSTKFFQHIFENGFLAFPFRRKEKRKGNEFSNLFCQKLFHFLCLFLTCFFMLFLHFFNFCNFFSLKKLHFFPKHFLFLFFQKSFSLFFTYFFPNFFQLSSQLFSPTSAWFQGTCFRASSADGRSVASKANIFAQSSASKWVKYAKSVAICFFIQKN